MLVSHAADGFIKLRASLNQRQFDDDHEASPQFTLRLCFK